MNPFIRCRTCFKQTNELYISISNICYLNKSVKEVITMLVPQMDKTLHKADFICKNCFEILRNSIIFIEKCLEVERKLEANREILNLYSNEYKGAATIRVLDEANQPLLNISANLTGDSTVEGNVQEMGGSVFLSPQFSENNIPEEKPKINCDVSLLPNLENKICTSAHFSTNEDNLQKDSLAFHLDNSRITIDHNSCTQAEISNIIHHNRIVTLRQPNSNVISDFIACLMLSEVNVLQISKDPEPSLSSGKKRVLLLGKTTTWKCQKCLKYFESIKLYSKHIVKCQVKCQKEQKVKAPPTRVCRLCNKKVEVHQMKLHRRQHEVEQRNERKQKKLKVRQCKTCSERFTSKEDYELHLELHPPHICEQCGKGFTHKFSLQAHKNTHNAPNSFICEICGKGYKDINNLRGHLKEHQNKMFKCDKCPKLFKTSSRLKKHVRYVHDKKYKVQCNQCGLLLSKSYLDLHIRLTHLKMRPFKCKICGKTFGRADYMQNHVKTHAKISLRQQTRNQIESNGKPLACKFCGKCISNIYNLQKHLKTHIKTRRYPCQFCSLTFVEESLRKRHELIHQNVDGIVRCDICYKRFKTKEEVNEHITTHKNPRYKCDTCGQLFHRRYLLNHHNSQEHMTEADLEEREEMLHKSLLESVLAD